MSTYGDRLPEGQVGGGSGVRSGQIASRDLVDLTGFTLHDLRDLRDAHDTSSLARALSRVMAGTDAERSLSFSSKI